MKLLLLCELLQLLRKCLLLCELLQLLLICLLLGHLLRVGLHWLGCERQEASANAASDLTNLTTQCGLAKQATNAATDQSTDWRSEQGTKESLW